MRWMLERPFSNEFLQEQTLFLHKLPEPIFTTIIQRIFQAQTLFLNKLPEPMLTTWVL
jgi:hypothetical protein